MDALCLKAAAAGIHTPISAAGPSDLRLFDKPSAQPRNSPWGFTFRRPFRSLLWKNRYEPAIALDDAVLVKDKEHQQQQEEEICSKENDRPNENWVLKILQVRSLWKDDGTNNGELVDEQQVTVNLEQEEEDYNCEECAVGDDDGIEFDKESFSKMLRKVPLSEARLYAKMSYLGSLAYSIPNIKPGNLFRHHTLRFVTSSLEKKELLKKEQAAKVEKEKVLSEEQQKEGKGGEAEVEANCETESVQEKDEESNGNRISASAAYHIAASAASYLHSHTKSFLRLKSENNLMVGNDGGMPNIDMVNHQDMASLMATTDSVTAVVAAKEEVKQAVADDLNSIRSSPCEWFVCDDDQSATRFFVIQGSESLSSWQANLLFEPIQFEGLDVLVHRGIYEAAKGIYEQMLPEVRSHLKTHGDRATFRFTGHSLGGSLSLLVNLMLLTRGEAPRSSLLPVITFGAPSIMCGGDRLLRYLGLPKNHLRSITMHRDIVPRAFSCNYPTHVAELLKAVNGNFRSHPCLNKQKLLYAPMGEFLILQPDDKFSPNHELLPSGSGLYIMTCPALEVAEAEKQVRAAQAVFLNSPHPLEILSDRSAYGSEGTILRDHDMSSYLRSVRNVIRQELSRIRKGRREQRRKLWWPLLAPQGINAGLIVSRPVRMGSRGPFNFTGFVQTGRESWKRFATLVASQHMHLLVVLLFPARLLVLGAYSLINVQ